MAGSLAQPLAFLTITPCAQPLLALPCPPPSPQKALASSDPESLAAVEGFTLSRRGVGSLRWLVPVDVRCLELDRIARIDQGGGGAGRGPRPC